MRSHAGIIIGILAGLLLSAIAGVIFLTRDITYEVDLENPNDKVQVEGLVKKYEMQVGENGEIFEVQNWTMDQDDIEIKVKAPPDFEKYSQLVVEAEFENPDAPTLEVGIKKQVDYLMGEPLYDWEWHFLDNKYLNEFKTYLGQEWSVISDENLGLSLFQKEQKYESVKEFLEKPPETKIAQEKELDDNGNEYVVTREISPIATVNYDFKQKYNFENFPKNNEESPLDNFTRIPYSFRGNLDMAIFQNNKEADITIEFSKDDFNLYEGEDIYEVRVFDDRKNLVSYQILADDGISKKSKLSNIQNYKIKIPTQKGELYFVEFRSYENRSDSMIRNIIVSSPYTLINNFSIVDQYDFLGKKNLQTRPITLFTLGGDVKISPNHDSSFQNIGINGKTIFLETPERFFLDPKEEPNSISTTKNNLSIENNSNFFGLTKESLFPLPTPHKQYSPSLIPEKNTSFIIASGLNQKKMGFDLQGTYTSEENTFSIKFRSNGLKIYNDEILFKDIKILLKN